MLDYQMATLAIGLSVAIVILWLVRRDHLHGSYAIWWFSVAAIVVLLGAWPGLVDRVGGALLGISYPPILAVVIGFSLVLVKLLTMDLERSRQERKIRRLAQQLAMLEAQRPEPTPAERQPQS